MKDIARSEAYSAPSRRNSGASVGTSQSRSVHNLLGASAILELPKSIQNLYTVSIAIYTILIIAASLELSPIVIICNLLWIFVVSFPIVFYRKGWGVEHPLVLLGILNSISLVLRQSYGMVSGLPFHIALPGYSQQQLNQIYCYGTIIQCLSLVMIYVGFMLSSSIKPMGIRQKRISRKKATLLVVGMVVVGILAFMSIVLISGDLTLHLKNIARGASNRVLSKDVGGVGPLALLVNLIGVAGVLAIVTKQPNWLTLVVCLLALSALFLTEGRRSSLIYPMVLFLYAWAITNRKIPFIAASLVVVLGIFVLAGGSAFRSSNWGPGKKIDFSALSNLTPTKAVKEATEEIQQRSNASSALYPIIARVPSEVDLLYGRGYAAYFNLFIPRFFWRDKPRGIDYQCGVEFFGVKWGMPPGSVGQAYWEFHIPGVIVVFFLFGVLKRWFYNTLKQNPLSYASLAVYLTGMFYMEPDQNSFRNVVFVFLPMLVCLIIWGGFRLQLGGGRQ